ncbi:MAG: hypothetical protein GC192_12150 [Bacteroidetes bacterium]|nr:hypothetical protein [Bacteroidota bacterium]
MKKLIFSIAVAIIFVGTIQASNQQLAATTIKSLHLRHQLFRKHVKNATLPQQVNNSLKNDFTGWAVAKDKEMIKKDGEAIYKIKLTKGDDKQRVRYNADGSLVKAKRQHEEMMGKKSKE